MILAGALLLALFVGAASLLAMGAEKPATTDSAVIRILIVLISLVVVSVLTVALILGWRGTNLAMDVTTTGIEVRGYFRTRRIPWEQVQIIESSTHWYWKRATCIVTTDGERVIPIVTSYQFLYFRGDPHDAVSRDPRAPQLPTRVAIDAHQRWLRGEFARSS